MNKKSEFEKLVRDSMGSLSPWNWKYTISIGNIKYTATSKKDLMSKIRDEDDDIRDKFIKESNKYISSNNRIVSAIRVLLMNSVELVKKSQYKLARNSIKSAMDLEKQMSGSDSISRRILGLANRFGDDPKESNQEPEDDFSDTENYLP
jgi:hypothetical protein